MPLLHGLPSGGWGTNVESVGNRQLDNRNCAFNFNPARGAEHAATPRPPAGRLGKQIYRVSVIDSRVVRLEHKGKFLTWHTEAEAGTHIARGRSGAPNFAASECFSPNFASIIYMY